MQFVEGLLDQLVAVRQDQGPAAASLHEQGEDDRFARAGGQHQQGAVHPAGGSGQQRGHGFMLVGPRRQAQQRGGSNGRHRGVPRRPGRVGPRHTGASDPRGTWCKVYARRHGTATAWPIRRAEDRYHARHTRGQQRQPAVSGIEGPSLAEEMIVALCFLHLRYRILNIAACRTGLQTRSPSAIVPPR